MNGFDAFLKSDSGSMPLPMPCALLALRSFLIIAPLRGSAGHKDAH
jgi:hypothetical protein